MLQSLGASPWWLLLLAAIGLLALSTVLLSLFSAVGDRPGTASVTQTCTVTSEDFLLGMVGTANAPMQSGGTARLLNNGDEFFPAIFRALREAQRTINFMVYIWQPGRLSEQLFEILTERARAGVAVRVMVDGLGGHKAPDPRIEELRRAGGRWEWFHPPTFGKLTRFHRRNHRRVIVVDGRIGFTGGAAVHDQWLGDAEPGQWRDSMVELRGCVATNLQSAFAQLWAQGTGEMLVGSDHFPPTEGAVEAEDPGAEKISRHINVISSPSSEEHPLRRVFWLSFRAAQRSLYITNPYFVPDAVTRTVLQERAQAGVDVRVLVPGEHIDLALIRWAAHHYYQQLLDAGVRIYEYRSTMLHQKLAVVDGAWSIVGSANMDVRSKELNQENILGLLDQGFAAEIEQTFFADLERATEITPDQWRRRPRLRRVRERIAALFEEQF